ncbi:MAG: acetylxylan esterase [Phycisphaerales bacterium]|nr:acetylxylan esterase [Phycisphaerales bacterium]
MKPHYLLGLALINTALAATSPDERRTNYFRAETESLARRAETVLTDATRWRTQRDTFRKQLFEMLGLEPLPQRGDLKPVVTGKVERDGIVVEKLHFQSLPGLYVTANLYLPKEITRPLPTILYLSGHGPVIKNGVSYGNKVSYQHHGIWFARHGYACLVLDTLQLGEIQGLHHGTYREGMWWWNSRGYTPAGVEAWNSIRALDYLETRSEVDKTRFGATGRSGGGAYSWWIVALDDRIKAAAPVAGITDLHNHVIDGTVEGHCDCMFTVNTYGWDYAQVAALAAPRPLLIANTDRDSIFPLEGVVRVHALVRNIYRSYNAETNLGLLISEGPHKDTQDLQVPVFRWFNRFLKGADPLIEQAAVKQFEPEELKVFSTLPVDAINTNIHDSFVAIAKPDPPPSPGERDRLLNELLEKSFRGWPDEKPNGIAETLTATRVNDIEVENCELTSQSHVSLQLRIAKHQARPAKMSLVIVDELPEAHTLTTAEWSEKLKTSAYAFFAPRGLGADSWTGDAKKQAQIRRRFMLLGQTLDSMRVWDIRQAIQSLRAKYPSVPLRLEGSGPHGVNLLYAALFENGIEGITLGDLPSSHRLGPDYLNVLRITDVPAVLKMVETKCPVTVQGLAAGK